MGFIPVNEPLLDGNEKKYLCECIDTGWISSEGPFVKEFEQKMSASVGRKYGIAVSNGTAALEVAVQALGIGEGDEVIMPTFTIISCAMAVTKVGAVPVLVDSDMHTWNMNADEIEAKITPRTKAIMLVHLYGLPADADKILAVAEKYGLKVIEEGGICINPYRSLIRNIGCDGSGVNCGITDFYDVALDEKKHQRYLLPDTADFSPEIEQAFAPPFGSYTAAKRDSRGNACPILVYGVGNCFFSNEKEINERYDIVAFVDKYKKGCYAGREIVKPDKIKDYEFEKLVIMVQDEREVMNIANDLVCQYGIPKNKIESSQFYD